MPIISFLPIAVIAFVLLVSIVRQVNQYERGVTFFLGRYQKIKEPGWRIVIPVFQSMTKVDIRTKAVDVPDQEAITKDNIPVRVNAVVYYRVVEASKAILEVENFYWAISQMAQTTMRNAVGEVTLDELLQQRSEIASRIELYIEKISNSWGIKVESVELKDVVLPEELKRTISKAAEAEREKRAIIIKAEGDKMAAENIAAAAEILGRSPGALHLRTLQTINDLSSDQSNTTVWMVPLNVLEAMQGFMKNGIGK